MNRHQEATYAAQRAKILFGGYRRGDANDPDTYVASIAAVLAMFSPEVIRRVTDPRSGISASAKFMTFMPNSGELLAFCKAEEAAVDRLRQAQSEPRLVIHRPTREVGRHLADVLVHTAAPQYPAMCERAKTEPNLRYWRYDEGGRGIWVVNGWLEDMTVARGPRRLTSADLAGIVGTKPAAAE